MGDKRQKEIFESVRAARLADVTAALRARRVTATPTADKPAPPPRPLPESAGDVHRRAIGLPPTAGQQDPQPPLDTIIPGTAGTAPSGEWQAYYDALAISQTYMPRDCRPKAPQAPDPARLERIRQEVIVRGYGDALLPDGRVLFANRPITLEAWAREHGI